jgi:hypothetical protein
MRINHDLFNTLAINGNSSLVPLRTHTREHIARSLCIPLMSLQQSPLGACPDCERLLPSSSLLIEYEQADGSVGQFAACPQCDTVVKPAPTE